MRVPQSVDALLAALPTPCPRVFLNVAAGSLGDRKVVIVDDDPTGSQTSANVDVLLRWSQMDIARALRRPDRSFFLLTNHRAYPPERAIRILGSAIHNLAKAARTTGIPYTVVLRSDSTLRGHYPLDVITARAQIAASGEIPPDLELHVPAFPEGGRFTIHGTQWLAVDNALVDVSATEFAKDPVFGYSTAYLPQWLCEKSKGVIRPSAVKRIDINQLRTASYASLSKRLADYRSGTIVVSDGADRSDLESLAAAIVTDARVAARVIVRSAATFASILGASYDAPRPTVASLVAKLHLPAHPRVLVVVGSHVQLSSHQLEHLRLTFSPDFYELPAPHAIAGPHGSHFLSELESQARASLRVGALTVIATPREVEANSQSGYWLDSTQMARAVARVVRALDSEYDIIVAKGGITSSITLTEGMRAARARVLGQLQTGVSVWRPYRRRAERASPVVVFPGNVGRADSLTGVVSQLRSPALR